MVFILNDDGFGIEIFIPKTKGIDADLLAMCAMYAEPATLELMLAARKLNRQAKEMKDGKPSAVTSLFTRAWDTLMAHLITALIGSLRIFLFFLFWGLILMALPTILSHL